MPAATPSIEQRKRAIAISEQIATLETELRGILGTGGWHSTGKESTADSSNSPTRTKRGRKKGKRQISPEGRARIAAAQKARWAKAKGA